MMNRRIYVLFVFVLSCLMLGGCSEILDVVFDSHECAFTNWYVTEESTCSQTGTEERYCVICFEEERRDIQKAPHTPEFVEFLETSCKEPGHTEGTRCSVCQEIISGIEVIPALEHTVVIDEAVEPTDEAPGKTEGKHCSVCGEIIVRQLSVFNGDYSNAARYDGDYAYNSLSNLENASAIQSFYDYIDEVADEFHTSDKDAKINQKTEKATYYVAELNYSDYGLSTDEAMTAWNAYRTDHPLYYWISGNITYTNSYITLNVYEEYADSDVRVALNDRIYSVVYNYVTALDGEAEEYLITLAFHDMIILSTEYVYEDDGITPSMQTEAHNIIGVLLNGEGVCESYAKTFQLLLNYCGIDNVYVTGQAGEPHAWNLVNLDSSWYWYDLTWDDTPEWGLGLRHSYFCVSENQIVNWQDGAVQEDPHAFLDDHTPYQPSGANINYNYQLPERASKSYDFYGELIRDNTIKIDGLHYIINGYNTVCLTKIEAEGDVAIPESITYNGRNYTVVSIGLFEDGFFKAGNILKYNLFTYSSKITSISIPKTVKFIWDYAFDGSGTIREFIVDEENPYFTSLDGVLFTKSFYTLVKYPMAKNLSAYSVPEQTVEIAFNAFGDGGNVFCPKSLDTLVIGENVEVIGAGNFGKGYRDGAPDDGEAVVMLDGYIDRLRKMIANVVIG